MSSNTLQTDAYSNLYAGGNLTDPGIGNDLDLQGRSGATLVATVATSLTLPAAPIGATVTVVASGITCVVTSTAGSLSATIDTTEACTFTNTIATGNWVANGTVLKDGGSVS